MLNYKMLENIDEKVEKDERYVLKNEYERDIKIASDNNINWLITAFSINEPPRRGCGEELYSRLWREFVKNIAVENRTNHKLQKCCMPARYWKYLTEMKPYDKLK